MVGQRTWEGLSFKAQGHLPSGSLSLQEHEKARRKKRDEQKKWEDLNLKQTSFEMSLDGRRSSAFPPQASIDRRPSFEPPPTFDTTFHP